MACAATIAERAPMPTDKHDHQTTDATFLVPADVLTEARKKAGQRRASLIIIAGEEIGKEFDLCESSTTIGRGEDTAARVASRSVSRQHARISRVSADGEEYFLIEDLGSMNGTLVNNVETKDGRLHDGDKVQLGSVVFKFVVQDAYDEQFYREVHRLIHYDQLTGLMTMDSFRRVLDDAIRFGKPGKPFTLAMTDLDGLKRVNDTYGHLAGRMIVGEMGAMMRNTLRPTDRVGLYGGDEAIVLFPNASLPEAQEVAERLRQVVEARVFEHEGNSFGVTISQGLAEWPRHGDSAQTMIAAADAALYAAKAAGRNCIRAAADTNGKA